jgi:hypothetical protein
MKRMNSKWRDDAGSIDFIQIVVGLMIVAIAAVGTFQALNYGNDKMNQQMRYRKAMSIARSYVEYWQGRIHTDFDPTDPRITAGNLNQPVDPTELDLGDPTTDADDVECYVRYGRLDPVDIQETGPGVDYWRINVQVTWWEPDQPRYTDPEMVTFSGTMVSAAL